MNYPAKTASYHVPIYDVAIKLGVCSNIRQQYKAWYGEDRPEMETYRGMVASREGRLSILFTKEGLKVLGHGLISHEIRHATDDILKFRGVDFGPSACFETSALLQEHITNFVYKTMKRWKIKL